MSCGQNSEEERRLSQSVRKVLEELKFEVYLGIRDNTLDSVRENLFRHLEDSEYFVFVDFKRERLDSGDYRGSVFSHQELALAAYFGTEAMGFHEKGVKREGIAWGGQLNSKEFTDRRALPGLVRTVVKEKIRQGVWTPTWKAQLSLARSSEQFGGSESDPPYIFHIEVTNHHWMKTAHACRALLWKAQDLNTDEILTTHSFELKWEGIKLPDCTIVPGWKRSFDAFEIYPRESTVLKWRMAFTDTEKVWPSIKKAGLYRLEFIVVSQNFWNVWAAFQLDLRPEIGDTELTIIDQRTGPTV